MKYIHTKLSTEPWTLDLWEGPRPPDPGSSSKTLVVRSLGRMPDTRSLVRSPDIGPKTHEQDPGLQIFRHESE